VQYFDEAKKIWEMFVPQDGQAETVQGELLRAIGKLRHEAIRNGNQNWDGGFEILLEYLEVRLLDPSVYEPTIVSATRAVLARLRNYEDPCLEDDLYDELADRVVEYFRFHGSQPHSNNPQLRR
jgi:hypothetical protein